jgi:general secretion pathway protein A
MPDQVRHDGSRTFYGTIKVEGEITLSSGGCGLQGGSCLTQIHKIFYSCALSDTSNPANIPASASCSKITLSSAELLSSRISSQNQIMYLKHYGFKIKPFGISPDSRFFWLGEKHAEALATLKYGILYNKGVLLVTGDVGTGKTALINRLIEELGIRVIVATIPDPELDLLDFFRILAVEFKMKTEFQSKGDFLIHFKNYLLQACGKNHKVLLIIDEAQRLSHELLEQIRLLSNIELNDRKLIDIFLVGQSELNEMLREERYKAISQRITLRYNIDPLTENETDQYIRHRLEIAGATKNIFTADAIREVFYLTHGYPRLINIICDSALLSGYVLGISTIDRKMIKACEEELKVSLPFNVKFAKDEIPGDVLSAEQARVLFNEAQKSAGRKRMGAIIILIMVMFTVPWGIYYLYHFEPGNDDAGSVSKTDPGQYSEPLSKNPPVSPEANEADTIKSAQPAKNGPLAEQFYGYQIQQPIQLPAEKNTSDDIVQEGDFSREASVPGDITALLSSGQIVPIYFSKNSTGLTDNSLEKLEKVREFLLKYPAEELTVEGYGDSSEKNRYNQILSRSRAYIVKSYLIKIGISTSRIKTFWMGFENQTAGNDQQERDDLNQQVAISIK